jgi:hypothetical protein
MNAAAIKQAAMAAKRLRGPEAVARALPWFPQIFSSFVVFFMI